MADILEELKLRFAESQKKFQVVQQEMQGVQQRFAVAQQEMLAWQNAVAFESRTQQLRLSSQAMSLPTANANEPETTPEVNKTDLIKQALSRNSGIKPADLWKELQGQVPKPYLYAVLSRLKHNKKSGVCEKRGKYYIQTVTKVEDNKEQTHIVQ